MSGERRSATILAVLLALLPRAVPAAEGEGGRAQVEADWFLQDRVRTGVRGKARAKAPTRRRAMTTKRDALGGVDGVIDGKWGFHTQNEANPWWHVDLGEKMPLDRVILYNRCDSCAGRNDRILLLLSDDGRTWKRAYRHNGPTFHGFTDKRPLVVKLAGKSARFVRLAFEGTSYFHLDEVQVYPAAEPRKNIALGKKADQSSTSAWSTRGPASAGGDRAPGRRAASGAAAKSFPFGTVLERGRKLAADLLANGAPVEAEARKLEAIAARIRELPRSAPAEACRGLYLDLRRAVRGIALANPLLDFDRILFSKRAPASYSHMSDQNYGHWSRPGGGLFILGGYREGKPRLKCLTSKMPVGTFLRPDLSYDAKRILFAHCRYYPQMRSMRDKTDKKKVPEDAKYHVYEMNIDGTGLRRLTRGLYDDFDPRYLPDGRIVFLSTRRGHAIQCGRASAEATVENPYLPDSYVRCGGGKSRPVAVYTLHVMDPDGSGLRAISAFENFEWTPSITNDGRILYARWDYVDRHNNAFMSLWATHPDGSFPNLVYGNFTRSPHCIFEARAIPKSGKFLFTASAHHAFTAGSICLLDVTRSTEGADALTRYTPEVCFPETEGWPATYYCNPYPLSEKYYLVCWSPNPIRREGGRNDTKDLGLYLADAFGNLELIYRDPTISSTFPLPLKARRRPHRLPGLTAGDETLEGRFLIVDVYRGLKAVPRGAVKRVRVVAVPGKTQPEMNRPSIGVTREDPGKVVLGTAPVEADGSAYLRVPSGVNVFLQTLDAEGVALQTMRTITYVQPGQTLSCIGCHESRSEAPPNARASAMRRPPSRLTMGPEGSWPLSYDKLVQPVLDRHCVKCHSPRGKPKACKKLDLTPAKSYAALAGRHKGLVTRDYNGGYSKIAAGVARSSPVLALLRKGHNDVKLDADAFERLVTWMDTYCQRQGHFSPEQEREIIELRRRSAALLIEREAPPGRRGHIPAGGRERVAATR